MLPMQLRTAVKRTLGPVIRAVSKDVVQLAPAHWRLRTDALGNLCLGPHNLGALATQHGTPLHVLDAAALRRNVEALAPLDIFYSYKTHPLPAVLRRLHAMDVGAEVISEMELDLALRLGVPPQRIIYNGPAKSDRSLHTAIERGILLLNLNHREELTRVAEIARACGQAARLGIRVNGSSGWSGQFGTTIADGSALALFREALQTPGVEVLALHGHRGTLIGDASTLSVFLDELLAFADTLQALLGWSPQILDVGGSLAIGTVRQITPLQRRLAQTFDVEIGAADVAHALSPSGYAAIVHRRVGEHYRRTGSAVPHVVIEPGRAVTGNAQFLLTRVVSIREHDNGRTMAILDAGINIASILHHERHQIFKVQRSADENTRCYRLVGPICQPGDVISNAVRLPHLASGDVLAIMDAGAYFESDSTVFSFPRPGTLIVDGKRIEVARRAETLDDVVARDAA
jgi:diaminopimelate decarboxylase